MLPQSHNGGSSSAYSCIRYSHRPCNIPAPLATARCFLPREERTAWASLRRAIWHANECYRKGNRVLLCNCPVRRAARLQRPAWPKVGKASRGKKQLRPSLRPCSQASLRANVDVCHVNPLKGTTGGVMESWGGRWRAARNVLEAAAVGNGGKRGSLPVRRAGRQLAVAEGINWKRFLLTNKGPFTH